MAVSGDPTRNAGSTIRIGRLHLKTTILLSAATLAFAAAAHAQPRALNDQASIIEALDKGKRVAVTIDLSRCAPGSEGQAASQTVGGLTSIESYRVVDSTLSFADTHVTVSSRGTPINQILRYRVRQDGSITFSSTIFNLPDYSLVNQVAFECAIGNGIGFVATK